MRNFTLIIIATMFSCMANAQIVNASFENWQTDTTVFAGLNPYLPAQTFPYVDPSGWTSSNSITAMSILGGYSFVTRSSNATQGSYAVQVITDTLAKVDGTQLILPGYLLNGSYQINVASFILGADITPISVKGAGQPCTQRLGDFKGSYNYTPVFNPNTNAYDTCLLWATLRKGDELIADAIYKSIANTSGYQSFNVPFVYYSCDEPDTLVILISSSIPSIPSLLSGGASKLVPGSVLLVDSISYDTLVAGTTVGPFAFPDLDTTKENTPVNIYVKANDQDCNESLAAATLSVVTQPHNGTVSIDPGNAFITYTPNNNFTGRDTFTYDYNDGTYTSNPTPAAVLVQNSAGVHEVPQIPVSVFPVPAMDELTVQFNNTGNATAKIYDMVGRQCAMFPLKGNTNLLPLSALSNGVYNLQIVNDNNQALANTRFVINR